MSNLANNIPEEAPFGVFLKGEKTVLSDKLDVPLVDI